MQTHEERDSNMFEWSGCCFEDFVTRIVLFRFDFEVLCSGSPNGVRRGFVIRVVLFRFDFEN